MQTFMPNQDRYAGQSQKYVTNLQPSRCSLCGQEEAPKEYSEAVKTHADYLELYRMLIIWSK